MSGGAAVCSRVEKTKPSNESLIIRDSGETNQELTPRSFLMTTTMSVARGGGGGEGGGGGGGGESGY